MRGITGVDAMGEDTSSTRKGVYDARFLAVVVDVAASNPVSERAPGEQDEGSCSLLQRLHE